PQAQQQQAPPAPAQVQAPPANPPRRMAFADLPGRMERAAPSFDDTQPEDLDQYFADIQHLLTRCNITDEAEQKEAALKYLKTCTERFWRLAEAFQDPTKTYLESRVEIMRYYPGATNNWTYTF